MNLFPVIHVNHQNAQSHEQLGTKSKFWFRSADNHSVLFKAEERGTGEDWAEKIACELCALLSLPHVRYDLAHDTENDVPGVICRTCVPGNLHLVHGNQLLFVSMDESYPKDERYGVREYTVDAVVGILSGLMPPKDSAVSTVHEECKTALGVFVGYVMLDAWIANQDRHHENWAAVWDQDTLSLAPTFDHGASMARNESDKQRLERLETKDVRQQIPYYASRARSPFYQSKSDQNPLPTHAAWKAFASHAPDAARSWLSRLKTIEPDTIDRLLARVPPHRMSPICRRFTLALLVENRRRLLEEVEEGIS